MPFILYKVEISKWLALMVVGCVLLVACGGGQEREVMEAEVVVEQAVEPLAVEDEEVKVAAVPVAADEVEIELSEVPLEVGELPPLAVGPHTPRGKALVIDQGLQSMGIFVDGVEIRRMAVSTGRPTYSSYTLSFYGVVGDYIGTFDSYTGGKADYGWFLYYGTAPIMIHGLPYDLVDGEKQYYGEEFLGVSAVSAGCIRVHPDDAEWLTDWDLYGVAISITKYPGSIEGLLNLGG